MVENEHWHGARGLIWDSSHETAGPNLFLDGKSLLKHDGMLINFVYHQLTGERILKSQVPMENCRTSN